MWALIPLKAPGAAKSRLSAALGPQARRALFFAMARHVVATCMSAREITRVCVVTGDDEVAAFARGLGASTIRDDQTGLADACNLAFAAVVSDGADGVLAISGDLPLVRPAEIERLCLAARTAKVAIAPDRHRRGTNALAFTRGASITACFGDGSYLRHIGAARSAGFAPAVVVSDGLAFDIDDALDLDLLRARSGEDEYAHALIQILDSQQTGRPPQLIVKDRKAC